MSLLSANQCSWLLAGGSWSTELADPLRDDIFPAALKEGTMAEAKLAPNLPDWMVEHANRYLSSGGTDGHMYKTTVPGLGEITAPALLLTTTGRKSGDKFILPLFYGTDGGSYFVIASKGGAPQHPGWYRNILANPDVEVQVGTKKVKARARTAEGEDSGGRGTSPTLEKGARILAAVRRLSAQDRTADTGGRAGPSPLSLWCWAAGPLDELQAPLCRLVAPHGGVRVVPETRRC
jgi:deazaflavin-dependent oxidoreductase (nitroreductase family)